jgi:uncharacterized protein
MDRTVLFDHQQFKGVVTREPNGTAKNELSMRELVENIAKALVDYPDDVRVSAVEGSQVTVLELRTRPDDLGKVIGRQGRTAKAIRTLLGASGMKLRRRFTLEIVAEDGSVDAEN